MSGMAKRDSEPVAEQEPEHDLVLVHGRTEDGEGLRALRSRPGSLALTELRPLREGQPLSPSAELVCLRERKESPVLWDVEVMYSKAEAAEARGHEGPARVSSDRFRHNWDRVFGGPRKPTDEPAN
jgi:hypothetical protein